MEMNQQNLIEVQRLVAKDELEGIVGDFDQWVSKWNPHILNMETPYGIITMVDFLNEMPSTDYEYLLYSRELYNSFGVCFPNELKKYEWEEKIVSC